MVEIPQMMMLNAWKYRKKWQEKVKKNTNDEGNDNKKTLVSCNYYIINCYIILKNRYLFYEELHL